MHRPGPARRGVWIPAATHDIAPIKSLPRPPVRPAGPRAPAASSRGTDCSLVRAERAVANAIMRVTGCAAGEPRVQVLRELHATPLRRQAQAERGGKAAAPRPQHRNRGGKSTAAPRERGAIETDAAPLRCCGVAVFHGGGIDAARSQHCYESLLAEKATSKAQVVTEKRLRKSRMDNYLGIQQIHDCARL